MSSYLTGTVESSQLGDQVLTSATKTTKEIYPDIHCNLISLLSLIQRRGFDFLPTTWNALDAVGEGATSIVNQSIVDIATNFVYKRTSGLFKNNETKAFRALMSEVFVLGIQSIRDHENIAGLAGICWEIDTEESICPVLVFEKAQQGDLGRYLRSEDGMASSFELRQGLCLGICKAIIALHDMNIVHGDIKPQNILVFQDESGRLTAKVIDFGYSGHGLNEDDTVPIPRSRPWCAPECDYSVNFSLKNAKKTDAYSFGMVCLYTLFRNLFGDDYGSGDRSPGEKRSETKLEEWKAGGIESKVGELLSNDVSLSEKMKDSLQAFFRLALPDDADVRNSDFRVFYNQLAGYPSDNNDLPESTNLLTPDINFHASFRIAEDMNGLGTFDYRVREQVAEALRFKASASDYDDKEACQTCVSQCAFQLAFCYTLGFGVGSDPSEASRLLGIAEKDPSQLEAEIRFVRECEPPGYKSKTLQELQSRGTLLITHSVERYVQRDDIPSRLGREISNWSKSLGSTHYLVQMLKTQMANYLFQNGDFHEAARLMEVVAREKTEENDYHTPSSLSCISNLVTIFQSMGNLKEAEEMQEYVLGVTMSMLGDDHPDTLHSMYSLGMILSDQGRLKEAAELQEKVIDKRKLVFGEQHADTLNAISNLASTYQDQGRWKDAEELKRQVVEKLKQTLGEDHPHTLSAIGNLASALSAQGRHQESIDLELHALGVTKRMFGDQHPSALSGMNNLALTYNAQGRWKEAEEILVKVLERRMESLGIEHRSTLNTMTNLASILEFQGRYTEGEELQLRTLETRRKALGEDHPDTLASLNNIASLYNRQGRLKEAEDMQMQNLKGVKKVLGENHPKTLTTMINLASILKSQGRYRESEELQMKHLDETKKVLGEEHPNTLNCLNNMASAIYEQGRVDEARVLQHEVMETRKRVYGKDHPDTLTAMNNLGLTLKSLGCLDEARELQEHILGTRIKLLGESNPHTLASMTNLALTLQAQRLWKEAEELQRKSLEAAKALGAEHPDTLSVTHNLVSLLIEQEQWQEAEALEKKVLATREKLLGQEHPDTWESLNSLVAIYTQQSPPRWKEAESVQVQLVESRKKVLGEDHLDVIHGVNNLVAIFANQVPGRWEEAEELQRQNLERIHEKLGENHEYARTATVNLTRICSQRRQWKKCEPRSHNNEAPGMGSPLNPAYDRISASPVTAPDTPKPRVTEMQQILPGPPQGVPREGFPTILDGPAGEDWESMAVSRHQSIKVSEYDARLPCLSITIKNREKLRQIVFTTRSHDQGWSGDERRYHGTYEASWTWFEAAIFGPDGKERNITPRCIQANVHASKEFHTHTNIWNVESSDQSLQEWMSALRQDDCIGVFAMARYPGWVNYVEFVKAEVFYAL